MEKPVLIAAASLDSHAYEPVRTVLETRGCPVVVYRTDKVLDGEEQLELNISEDGELTIKYQSEDITPDAIGAAWYRKVANFSLSRIENDRARQQYVTNEVRHFHDTFWSVYPESVWLNSPEKMKAADKKLGQILLARELGFSVPQTVITSGWNTIDEGLLSQHPQIVVKVVRGIVSENDKIKALYTTALDSAKVNELRDYSSPFPGIYQPFIDKAREWRVTVVGGKVFPAAIYTDKTAKVDWRLHQTTQAVRFEEEELSNDVAERCIQYLGMTGLKFGAFDFIEKPDGDMVFLECNPNGQYGWLEEELGFPISAAIADELISIRDRN